MSLPSPRGAHGGEQGGPCQVGDTLDVRREGGPGRRCQIGVDAPSHALTPAQSPATAISEGPSVGSKRGARRAFHRRKGKSRRPRARPRRAVPGPATSAATSSSGGRPRRPSSAGTRSTRRGRGQGRVARPIPDPAPVTRATRPVKRPAKRASASRVAGAPGGPGAADGRAVISAPPLWGPAGTGCRSSRDWACLRPALLITLSSIEQDTSVGRTVAAATRVGLGTHVVRRLRMSLFRLARVLDPRPAAPPGVPRPWCCARRGRVAPRPPPPPRSAKLVQRYGCSLITVRAGKLFLSSPAKAASSGPAGAGRSSGVPRSSATSRRAPASPTRCGHAAWNRTPRS